MKKKTNKDYYSEKLNIILEYINDNLDKKISISDLAKISNFSNFHFHRLTRALLNEPVGSYITRRRLESAARLIRYSSDSIEQIAFSVGYETLSSLSKQFKKHFGLSPSAYRKIKKLPEQKNNIMKPSLNIKKPKLVKLEKSHCIYIRMNGNYKTLDYGNSWNKLWSHVKSQKLFTAGIEHIGIAHDDPEVSDPNASTYDACLVIHKEAKPEGEVGTKDLNGGKFMMFHYTGSYTKLSEVYNYIFKDWLLNCDYELRDAPVREKYRNNPDKTEEFKLKTEIYIPVK